MVGCRYELREDRKRAELQTAGHVESLRRDILRFVGAPPPPPPLVANSTASVYPFTGRAGSARHGHRSAGASRHSSVEREVGGGDGEPAAEAAVVAPRPCGNCGAGAGYPPGLTGTAAVGLGTDLDAVKREIALGLRAEIRELVREVALVATGGGRGAAGAGAAAGSSPASVAAAGPGSRSAPPRLSTPSQPPAASSGLGADLYQTHLYTQL